MGAYLSRRRRKRGAGESVPLRQDYGADEPRRENDWQAVEVLGKYGIKPWTEQISAATSSGMGTETASDGLPVELFRTRATARDKIKGVFPRNRLQCGENRVIFTHQQKSDI